MNHMCIVGVIAAILSIPLRAQVPWCATDEKNEAILVTNPEVIQQVADYVSGLPKVTLPENSVRVIPVVVHVLHDGDPYYISDQDIIDAIDRLNQDFRAMNSDTSIVRPVFKPLIADMQFEFRLAGRDYRGYCTNGIVREYNSATNNGSDNAIKRRYWPTNRYLNIYVVKSIASSGGGTILGYAYYPQSAAGQRHDGVVIRASEMNGSSRTLTHEVGHYLGLAHTFQGGCSLAGDGVDDTPPVESPNWGCPWSTNSCSVDSPDLPDMIENYMDYSSCQALFTVGQKQRADNLYSIYRAPMSASENLQYTGVDGTTYTCRPLPRFVPEKEIACTDESIRLYNRSLYKGSPNFSWTMPGASPTTSSADSPLVSYANPGVYPITLSIIQDGTTEEWTDMQAITVVPGEAQVQGAWMHQIAPTMPEWMFLTNEEGRRWEITSQAAYSGTHSIYFRNFQTAYENEEVHLLLPPVDVTMLDVPQLKFKYAHARLNAQKQDMLIAYVSTDCGTTWRLRWFGSGPKIASIGGLYLRSYVPSSRSEWDSVTIDLSPYASAKHLLVRLTFRSGQQNNIFIDDIQFGATPTIISGVGNGTSATRGVLLQNKVLRVVGYRRLPIIELFSMDGRRIVQTRAHDIMLHSYPTGTYWVRITDREDVLLRKVIIR